MVTLDQGMMAMFQYAGLDAEGRSDAESSAAVDAFESAFSSFGSGSTAWAIVDRRKTDTFPDGNFVDPVSRFINDTWAEAVTGNQFENTYTLAVHQRSNTGTMALFDTMDLLVKEEGIGLSQAFLKAIKTQLSLKARKSLDGRRMKAAKNALEEKVATLESALSNLGLRRLKGEELLADLYNRVNPASPRRSRFPVPGIPAFLNTMLCSDQLQRTSDSLVFTNNRRKYVGVVSLKGFSDVSETQVGQLDWLTSIPGEVTVSHCFRFIDRDVAEKMISSIERYNISKSVPFLHRMMTTFSKTEPTKFNDGRLALAQDAKAALVDLYQANRAFGHHNLTVLCYGETHEEMLEVRRQVIENLKHSRFTGYVERMHQLSAYTQTIPGQWAGSVRWNFVSYGNASDIAPIRTLWTGPKISAHLQKELARPMPALTSVPTSAGTPAFIDLWEIGVGHTKFIGPTRAGKSTVVNFFLSQFRKYEPCRTICIDKDYSCRIATLLQGGVHIDLNQSSKDVTRMAPLSLLEDVRHHAFLVNWIIEVIEAGRNGVMCTPAEVEKITQTVRGIASLPPEMWTLANLGTSLGPDLGAYLGRWVKGGADGDWFDNPPVKLSLGRHVTFECKDLFGNPTVARLAMSYLFYVIEGMLDDTPTIVNIEETWFFLENEAFARKIDDFLRTLGKRNGSLWMVTQTLSEIDKCSIRNSILSNVPNTVYLPDRNIAMSAELYENVAGLLPEEIARIQGAQEKRHYYLKTPSLTRMLDVRLPEEIVVCLSSGSRARATFDKHYATREANSSWKEDYFKEMMSS